jgi:hypothetical protein
VIPCAYLRVFRPLDTFPDAERAHWERYIVDGAHARASRPVYRLESFDQRGKLGLLSSAEGEHADVRLIGSTYHVCPWRTRLRVLASLLSLRENTAAEVAEAFVPETEVRRAARELARLKRREPSAVPSMLQSPWHVPVRWFLLVDDDERRLGESAQGDPRLSYWTPLPEAKRRVERALQLLRRSELSSVAETVQDLAQWLSAFGPRSMVELDYAAVSGLFTWDELDNDHSGRDLQEAVTALGRPGGIGEAMQTYQAVAWRWAEARQRESLN